MPTPPESYTVAVVSRHFNHEWHVGNWAQAVKLARQAAKEFPGRLVFFGDSRHVWLLSELEQR